VVASTVRPVPDPAPRTAPRAVGRPPRINRSQIIDAANAVGLDRVTLKAVAAHLDVSIGALYHHFPSKDHLVRAAAEVAAGKIPLPADADQHWAEWLLEWGWYIRGAFASEPALLTQFTQGWLDPDAMARTVEPMLGLLVRQGFAPRDALVAYETVSSFALGEVLGILRRRSRDANTGWFGSADADALATYPHLHQVARGAARRRAPTFEDRIEFVLAGIAASRGADVDEVREVVRRASARRRRSTR